MDAMIERRSHPRIRVSHPALYFSHIYPRPRVASTVDLSLGGTRIETPYSLIFGEHLDISIAIRPQVIQCRGRVVHVRTSQGEDSPIGLRFEAGIRFEGMSEQDRLYLTDYLSGMMEEVNPHFDD